jgi:hypothetical protein
VFDYTKRTRKSYYHGPKGTARMVTPMAPLAVPRPGHLQKDEVAEERSQLCSTTGLDIEGQIADGGGLAALRDSPTYPPEELEVSNLGAVRSGKSR